MVQNSLGAFFDRTLAGPLLLVHALGIKITKKTINQSFLLAEQGLLKKYASDSVPDISA